MKNSNHKMHFGRRLIGLGLAAVLGFGLLSGTATPVESMEWAGPSVSVVAVAAVPVADADQVVGAQGWWRYVPCVGLSGAGMINPVADVFAKLCWKIAL